MPKRIELSQEIIDKLIYDYHILNSIRDVASTNGLGYKTVWRILHENNVNPSFGNPRKEVDIEMMKEYYKEDEIFLPVVGYENLYEISNYGRLKRLETSIHVVESGKDYYRVHGNNIFKLCKLKAASLYDREQIGFNVLWRGFTCTFPTSNFCIGIDHSIHILLELGNPV